MPNATSKIIKYFNKSRNLLAKGKDTSAPHKPAATLTIEQQQTLSFLISQQSLKLANKIWSLAIVTLPLDFMLCYSNLSILQYIVNLPAFFPLTVTCLGLTALYSIKPIILDFISKLQDKLNNKISTDRLLFFALIALLLLGLAIELFRSVSTSLLSVVVQLIIYASLIQSQITSQKNVAAVDKFTTALKRDYFLTVSLPIITTRLLSPLMIIYLLSYNNYAIVLTSIIMCSTFVMLLSFQPHVSDFKTLCRGCNVFIAKRLFNEPLCKNCQIKS